MTRWIALMPLVLACTSERSVPDDFILGAAVAGFQVEMGCPTMEPERCEDRNSDWYQFITSTVAIARSGNFLKGDPPSYAPGYRELFAEDIARR